MARANNISYQHFLGKYQVIPNSEDLSDVTSVPDSGVKHSCLELSLKDPFPFFILISRVFILIIVLHSL